MGKRKSLLEKPWAAYTMATFSAVVLYLFLTHLTGPVAGILRFLGSMAAPIVIGAVFAYLLDPLVKLFERSIFKKIKKESKRRTFSVLLTLLCALFIIGLLLWPLLTSHSS